MDEGLIRANLAAIKGKVQNRCVASGIDPSGVKILGVTKFVPAEAASTGVRSGLTDLGENRVQEAAEKIPLVTPRPRWHLIGHLQKNKVKRAVELFDLIESVDSLELAESISRRSLEIGKKVEILLQLNSSGEISKYGFNPGDIFGSADKINELPGLKVTGIMTMGPLTGDVNLIRRSFELTRGIFETMRDTIGPGFEVLSMGMSGDFELAVECGSNEIRIGTAIFGRRPIAE